MILRTKFNPNKKYEKQYKEQNISCTKWAKPYQMSYILLSLRKQKNKKSSKCLAHYIRFLVINFVKKKSNKSDYFIVLLIKDNKQKKLSEIESSYNHFVLFIFVIAVKATQLNEVNTKTACNQFFFLFFVFY